MRIGTNVWPGYEPLYLADRLGYLDRDKIHLVEFPSANGVIRGLTNYSIDAGALTIDEVLRVVDRNIPVKIILIMDISNGGDVILGRRYIEKFSELKGRRVAVEKSALGAYILSRALTVNNMTAQDLQTVNVMISEQEQAFKNGKVDAVVTFEPVRRTLLSLGANELFSSRQIPGEIVDVLAVHEDYLKENPYIINQLIGGWYKALEFIKKEPHKAAEHMSHRLQMSPQEVLDSFTLLHLPDRSEVKKMMERGTKSNLFTGIEGIKKMMLREKLLKNDVPVENLMNSRRLN